MICCKPSSIFSLVIAVLLCCFAVSVKAVPQSQSSSDSQTQSQTKSSSQKDLSKWLKSQYHAPSHAQSPAYAKASARQDSARPPQSKSQTKTKAKPQPKSKAKPQSQSDLSQWLKDQYHAPSGAKPKTQPKSQPQTQAQSQSQQESQLRNTLSPTLSQGERGLQKAETELSQWLMDQYHSPSGAKPKTQPPAYAKAPARSSQTQSQTQTQAPSQSHAPSQTQSQQPQLHFQAQPQSRQQPRPNKLLNLITDFDARRLFSGKSPWKKKPEQAAPSRNGAAVTFPVPTSSISPSAGPASAANPVPNSAQQVPPTVVPFLPPSEAPLFLPTNEPPPGFAGLNEPQTTLLNVFYNGRPIGSAEATFTPTWVKFTNPQALVDQIKDVKDKDKKAVVSGLSGQLAPNADLVCADKKPIPVCHIPTMKDAAIVFDFNTYRAELFVAAEHMLPSAKISDLLPPPTAGRSFSDDISIVTAGSSPGGNPSYNFNQQGALVNGPGRINYELSYFHTNNSNNNTPTSINGIPTNGTTTTTTGNNQGRWAMQQLNAEWDHKQYALQAGYIETTGDTFIGNQNILGASFGTTLRTLRQETRDAYGSSLLVFLSLPSQVSILRDNRLLFTNFYPAGQQQIDTTALPAGSYPIVIRIQDNLGVTSEETRFFVKSTLIPPKNYPIYYANAGYLTNQGGTFSSIGGTNSTTFLPQVSSTLLYQVGLNRRIGDNWGVNADVIGSQDNGYLSSGVFVLLPYYQLQLQPQVVAGTKKEYGAALTANALAGKFNMNVNARKLWAQQNQTTTVNNVIVTQPTFDFSVFDPLAQNQSQLGIGMGYSIGNTNINVNSNWNRSNNQASNYSYGVNTRSILHRFRNRGQLELDLSAARSSQENLLLIGGLVWQMNTRVWDTRLSSGYQQAHTNTDQNGVVAAGNLTWRNYNAAQQGTSIGTNVNYQKNQESAGLNVDELNRYLNFLGQTQTTRQRTNTNSSTTTTSSGSPSSSSTVTQYSGTLGSRFVWAQGGSPNFGGARAQDAGVIVDIDSDLPGQEFQVLNNNQVAGVVKTNKPQPVFLNSYREYPLAIKAVAKNSDFSYDETPKDIVLYPGNYQYVKWQAKQKLIIFTRVMLPNHKPLPTARVKGSVDFNYTDDQGYIQLEVFQDTRELEFQQAEDQRCTVHLPQKLKIENGYSSIDSVVCVSVPGSKPMSDGGEEKPPAAVLPDVPAAHEQKEEPAKAAPTSTVFDMPWYKKEEKEKPPAYFNLEEIEEDLFALMGD